MLNFFKEILLISPKNRLLKGQFEYKVVRKFYFILLFFYIIDVILILYYKHFACAFLLCLPYLLIFSPQWDYYEREGHVLISNKYFYLSILIYIIYFFLMKYMFPGT